MKKPLSILLLLCLLLCTACTSGGDKAASPASADATDVPTAESVPEVFPGEDIAQQLIEDITPELLDRAVAAGYSVGFGVYFYEFDPDYEDKQLPEGAPDNFRKIHFGIRSPIGSAIYGNYTVDDALMLELQEGFLNSDVISLSEEEKEQVRAEFYTQENTDSDLQLKNSHFFTLDTVVTPSGYEAYVNMAYSASPDGSLDSLFSFGDYEIRSSIDYRWPECTQNIFPAEEDE